MRANLPVTGVERHLEEGQYILSKSDLRGNITYVNRTLMDITGFSEVELMNQPHNMLRHPDMPPEAFRDFWSTLKSGKSWSGLVKNRCKNGDHYWVMANASPIWQNGTVVGYMSVRSRPDRRMVDNAEQLYRSLRNNETNVTLSEGRVVQKGLKGLIGRMNEISIGRRLSLAMASTVLFWSAIAFMAARAAPPTERLGIWLFSLLGMGIAGIQLLRTYRTIATPLQLMKRQMQEITNGNYALLVNKERADEIGEVSDAFKSMFIKLRFEMADSQRAADEAVRMRYALDNVSTPVTVSNEDNNLIYMNKAGRQQLETVFKSTSYVDSMYGRPIAESVEDERILVAIRGKLERPQVVEGDAGGRIIRIATTPVIDDRGVYVGRVCQWQDRTVEVGIEREVSQLVEAAAAGNFTSRISANDKEGFFKSLAIGLNQLVEGVDNGLADVVRVLNALAQGDLSQTIDRDYQGTLEQMKIDANATVAQLKGIVSTITEATDAINSAAKEIASGNADLSRRTESQAASLEETASSTEELTNTVRNNADNAGKAMELARNSREVADRGGRVVSEVVDTMGAIQESSGKIAEIINVIDGIAFQTNILALNAAVEAARAGEQGRGFAVVAGEVRNLAQRSASAAREIKELISESVAKVSNGYKLVETAGQTMQEIVSSTQDVASIMSEIAQASDQQRTGIMQLNQAITSLDETTQQNAALVEEAAAAAQSLEDQSVSLTQSVSVFSLDGRSNGGKGARVERLPVRGGGLDSPARLRAVARAKPKAAGNTAKLDDEWEEF